MTGNFIPGSENRSVNPNTVNLITWLNPNFEFLKEFPLLFNVKNFEVECYKS